MSTSLLDLSFPYKLWLMVHVDFYDFIRWNLHNNAILLDLAGLEIYLNSACTMFSIKNHSSFIQKMEEYRFERMNIDLAAGEYLLVQYSNPYFQPNRLDLVAQIRNEGDKSPNYEYGDNDIYEPCRICVMPFNCFSKILSTNVFKEIMDINCTHNYGNGESAAVTDSNNMNQTVSLNYDYMQPVAPSFSYDLNSHDITMPSIAANENNENFSGITTATDVFISSAAILPQVYTIEFNGQNVIFPGIAPVTYTVQNNNFVEEHNYAEPYFSYVDQHDNYAEQFYNYVEQFNNYEPPPFNYVAQQDNYIEQQVVHEPAPVVKQDDNFNINEFLIFKDPSKNVAINNNNNINGNNSINNANNNNETTKTFSFQNAQEIESSIITDLELFNYDVNNSIFVYDLPSTSTQKVNEQPNDNFMKQNSVVKMEEANKQNPKNEAYATLLEQLSLRKKSVASSSVVNFGSNDNVNSVMQNIPVNDFNIEDIMMGSGGSRPIDNKVEIYPGMSRDVVMQIANPSIMDEEDAKYRDSFRRYNSAVLASLKRSKK